MPKSNPDSNSSSGSSGLDSDDTKSDSPDDFAKRPIASFLRGTMGDAIGAGLALVVLPCAALYFGMKKFADNMTVGLPVLAIFGIMILFGSLALVATLYRRLKLADRRQALALPEGSIRAAIALSLIVLFAILSIMLYRTMVDPYQIPRLTLEERKALLDKAADRLVSVVEECAVGSATMALRAQAAASAASAASAGGASDATEVTQQCAERDRRYTVHLRPPPAQDSTDFAKQLLILIGTLMTSVTSFYFASRGAAPPKPEGVADLPAAPPPVPVPNATPNSPSIPAPIAATIVDAAASGADGTADRDAHTDGCNVSIDDPTPDEELPAAAGGVAS